MSAQPRGAHWRCTDFIPEQLRVLEDATSSSDAWIGLPWSTLTSVSQ